MRVRPEIRPERVELDARSWVVVQRGWFDGAAELYELLAAGLAWRQGSQFRYERSIDEPRLGAGCPVGEQALHPVINELQRAVRSSCGRPVLAPGAAWYRSGADSMAWHRDRDLRHLDDTIVAILTLGATRPFLLRPRAHRDRHGLEEVWGRGGATHDLRPAAGDLLVMGGAMQQGWEHAVPKVPALADGRISLQWRWTSGRGRPVVGPSYRAPRTYSRR